MTTLGRSRKFSAVKVSVPLSGD